MIHNGKPVLIRVTVKQPSIPGQHWWVSAPVKIPPDSAPFGRGVVFKPASHGHRAEWQITAATTEFACELARDLIDKEISMRKSAYILWQRMVREISDSTHGTPVL